MVAVLNIHSYAFDQMFGVGKKTIAAWNINGPIYYTFLCLLSNLFNIHCWFPNSRTAACSGQILGLTINAYKLSGTVNLNDINESSARLRSAGTSLRHFVCDLIFRSNAVDVMQPDYALGYFLRCIVSGIYRVEQWQFERR